MTLSIVIMTTSITMIATTMAVITAVGHFCDREGYSCDGVLAVVRKCDMLLHYVECIYPSIM